MPLYIHMLAQCLQYNSLFKFYLLSHGIRYPGCLLPLILISNILHCNFSGIFFFTSSVSFSSRSLSLFSSSFLSDIPPHVKSFILDCLHGEGAEHIRLRKARRSRYLSAWEALLPRSHSSGLRLQTCYYRAQN